MRALDFEPCLVEIFLELLNNKVFLQRFEELLHIELHCCLEGKKC